MTAENPPPPTPRSKWAMTRLEWPVRDRLVRWQRKLQAGQDDYVSMSAALDAALDRAGAEKIR